MCNPSGYFDTVDQLFNQKLFTHGNWITDEEDSCYLYSLLPVPSNLGISI